MLKVIYIVKGLRDKDLKIEEKLFPLQQYPSQEVYCYAQEGEYCEGEEY